MAVCALIVDTVIKLVKGVFKNKKAVVIWLTAFTLSAVWGVSPMLLIAAAGLLGLLVFRQKPADNSPAPPERSSPPGASAPDKSGEGQA